LAAEIVVFSWFASYRQRLREAQTKADEATDPAEKAAHEKLVKQWEGRVREEERRVAATARKGPGCRRNRGLPRSAGGQGEMKKTPEPNASG
jgi:hypothetical protein